MARILFSPVGRTDPISERNYRDGALLHICRWYEPDTVYLYLTEEMSLNEALDHRYSKALNLLNERQQSNTTWQLICDSVTHEVQDFNIFYKIFREHIAAIYKNRSQDDTLLINISSGTPAMKSALTVMATLGEFPCKLIQVLNPDDREQKFQPEKYDIDLHWAFNEDNNSEPINRCVEIACPSLQEFNDEVKIKQLVASFNYRAALELAQLLPEDLTAGYLPYLKMARARETLDITKVSQLSDQLKADIFPVKDGAFRKIFEYALTVKLKLDKGDLADFLRSLTPLLLDVFRLILKKQKQDVSIYFSKPKKATEASFCWDREALKSSEAADPLAKEILNQLKQIHTTLNKTLFVSSAELSALIQNSDDFSADVKNIVQKLREIERKVRNLAAHQIVSISEQMIKDKTGSDPKQIMDLLRKAFGYTEMNVKASGTQWDSYLHMNKQIAAKINIYSRH